MPARSSSGDEEGYAARSGRSFDAVAARLAACPDRKVVLFDDDGTSQDPYRRAVVVQRLRAAREALLLRGVSPAQIVIDGAEWDGREICCTAGRPAVPPVDPGPPVAPDRWPLPGPPAPPAAGPPAGPAPVGATAGASATNSVQIAPGGGAAGPPATSSVVVNVWGQGTAPPAAAPATAAPAATGAGPQRLDYLGGAAWWLPAALLLLGLLAVATLLLGHRARRDGATGGWFRRSVDTGRFDDLTRIDRIDPPTAALLATLGVTRFEQIAQWRRRDIEAIDRRLVGRHGDIVREDWVGQANALLRESGAALSLRPSPPDEPAPPPEASRPPPRARPRRPVAARRYDRARLVDNLRASSVDIPILTPGTAQRFADQLDSYSNLHLEVIETIAELRTARVSDLAGVVGRYRGATAEVRDHALRQLLDNLVQAGMIRRVDRASGGDARAEEVSELTELGQQFVHHVMTATSTQGIGSSQDRAGSTSR